VVELLLEDHDNPKSYAALKDKAYPEAIRAIAKKVAESTAEEIPDLDDGNTCLNVPPPPE